MVSTDDDFFRYAFAWRYVIADEGHRLKNEVSKQSLALSSVPRWNAMLLTGTPTQNNAHELWALLSFLLPDVFISSDAFDSSFSADHMRREQIDAAQRLLSVLMIRRTKADITQKLPPKTQIKLYCPMSEYQQMAFQRMLLPELQRLMQYQSDVKEQMELKRQAAEAAESAESAEAINTDEATVDGDAQEEAVDPAVTEQLLQQHLQQQQDAEEAAEEEAINDSINDSLNESMVDEDAADADGEDEGEGEAEGENAAELEGDIPAESEMADAPSAPDSTTADPTAQSAETPVRRRPGRPRKSDSTAPSNQPRSSRVTRSRGRGGRSRGRGRRSSTASRAGGADGDVIVDEDEMMKLLKQASGATGMRHLLGIFMNLRKVCNHPYLMPELEPMLDSAEEIERDWQEFCLQNGFVDASAPQGVIGVQSATDEQLSQFATFRSHRSAAAMIDSSGKMQVLDTLLHDLLTNGHRVLIFSLFTSMLDLLEQYCKYRGFKYCRLDGSTNRVRRQIDIKRFNEPNSPYSIYLISTVCIASSLSLYCSH